MKPRFYISFILSAKYIAVPVWEIVKSSPDERMIFFLLGTLALREGLRSASVVAEQVPLALSNATVHKALKDSA